MLIKELCFLSLYFQPCHLPQHFKKYTNAGSLAAIRLVLLILDSY